MRLVLDAEAVSVLIGGGNGTRRTVRRSMEAARRLGRDVAVPTLALAGLYRGAGHSQALDSLLTREEEGILLRDTDRQLARLVGAVLTQARLGPAHIVDAHAVAVAVEDGGGVILTGDVADLEQLAAPYRTIAIERI